MKNNKFYIIKFAIAAVFLMLNASTKIFAFNYTISFTGTGESTFVESVVVKNLTKGTTVTVPATNVLNLSDVATSTDYINESVNGISISPNPMQTKSTVSFFAMQAGNTQISVFGIDGRDFITLNSNLQEGINTIQLSLASGAYFFRVSGNGFSYFSKVISQTNTKNKPLLTFLGNEKKETTKPQKSKNGGNVTSMLYSVGDQLLYKGISGNFATIVTDVPVTTKTINFEFVSCQDADLNNYTVVTIGGQTWTVENLQTTKYRDNSTIPNVIDNTAWSVLNAGAWCYYNNDVTNGSKYGKLYNWYSLADSRNIAPTGWHVATKAEWEMLEATLDVNFEGWLDIGKHLAATTDWFTSTKPDVVGNNLNLNNSSGFSALPAGARGSSGACGNVSIAGYWWCSTQFDTDKAWYRVMLYDFTGIEHDYFPKRNGAQVRCVKDNFSILTTTAALQISSTAASSGGNVINDGSVITARGVCWSTSHSPTIELSTKTIENSSSNSFTSTITGLSEGTKYYIRAYATNNIGTAYGNEQSVTMSNTVSDNDGNSYHIVNIGTQTWMVENLRTTKYRDNSSIPNVTDNASWVALNTGAWCYYNNDVANNIKYGKLYNWYTVTDSRNIAPIGWHVATDADWSTLATYVSANFGNSINVAKGLAATSDWSYNYGNNSIGSNLLINNYSGFNALPGGSRDWYDSFTLISSYGYWWSSSFSPTNEASSMILYTGEVAVRMNNISKQNGLSVRCIKD